MKNASTWELAQRLRNLVADQLTENREATLAVVAFLPTSCTGLDQPPEMESAAQSLGYALTVRFTLLTAGPPLRHLRHVAVRDEVVAVRRRGSGVDGLEVLDHGDDLLVVAA